MTGPDHYREAEELSAKAHEYLGQGDGQNSAAVWAAVAKIHATLALAAATALGTTPAEDRAWADVAGTKFSAGGRWCSESLKGLQVVGLAGAKSEADSAGVV
jgi:hypothetical protein